MKLKSLLIGSAAVMAVSTGTAKAADAIVMAEPEPMEYVRICDVYGTGFFYIPGTETCMKIGGYVRYEIYYQGWPSNTYNNAAQFQVGGAAAAVGTVPSKTWSRGRFAPSFDVRSETEMGTLRGYAEVEINYDSITHLDPFSNHIVLGGTHYATLAHAYIQVSTASGTVLLGKTHRPYATFLGYGASGLTFDGAYGFGHANVVSYTFNGSNGFSAIIAGVSDGNANWLPDIEVGVNFAQGWGSIGAIAGYDESTGTWGAKAVARFSGNNGFSGGLHVFYTSGAGQYDVGGALMANWSVLAHVSLAATQNVSFNARAQWFDSGALSFGAALAMTPVQNLLIRPEISYTTVVNEWAGVLRVQRTF